MTIKSINDNYNIILPIITPARIQYGVYRYTKESGSLSLNDSASSVLKLFNSVIKKQISEIDLFSPLGVTLKGLVKSKIESLNLFYDDLPEVKEYYKLFIEDLSSLYLSRLTQRQNKADPFVSLIAIDQALKNVGVESGLGLEGFQELFSVISSCDEILAATTYSFSNEKLARMVINPTVPVKLSLILQIAQTSFSQMRAEAQFLLDMSNEAVDFPEGLDNNIFHANWKDVRSNLQRFQQNIPFSGDLESFSVFKRLLDFICFQFPELKMECLECLKNIENALANVELVENEEVMQVELYNMVDTYTRDYNLTREQLILLKRYYQFHVKISSYFEYYIVLPLKSLKGLSDAVDEWRISLSSEQVKEYFERAVNELYPDDHQSEADQWLSELGKEKAIKGKKGQKQKQRAHGPAKAPGKKKVALIEQRIEKTIQISYPHPVLFEMISSVADMGQSSMDALKQAYLYETDLKWIEKQVRSGVSNPPILTALFLSTIRTSYLYLEQLFRCYHTDLPQNRSLERTHDLYSFSSTMRGIDPELVRDLFLGNFWIDYPEDHLGRWKRAGAVIDHSIPKYLERSEQAYKRGAEPVEPAEILQLIRNVFTARSRWVDLTFKKDAFGSEDLREEKSSWNIPQLSFKQVNASIQRLKDQRALDGESVGRLLRLLSYLESTLNGQSKEVTRAEFSYIVRTALHLMHLLLESGFENFGEKNNIRISREHHLLKLAEIVKFPLTKKKKSYLKRFFEIARHISSYPYDKTNSNSDLVPLIMKLDYKANYALHQKERRLFPKIDLKRDQAQAIITSLFNGFTPMLEDLLKSLET